MKSPRKKTLVITYKSGRVERIRLDSEEEARAMRDKLSGVSSVQSVEWV